MFPDFRYLIHGIFGSWPPEWLGLFKTFGFLVALSFIAATWVMIRELRRKEDLGLMQPQPAQETIGEAPTFMDALIPALLGFFIGLKVGGLAFGGWAEAAPNPMGYLVSLKGNLLIGLVLGAGMGAYRYYEKKKAQKSQPEIRRTLVYPHQRISEIVVIAAIGGLVGAKIFNALETWDSFIADPINNLINSSGLTFYGGFITATAIFYFYARKLKVRFAHLCDAAAPAIMIAYGIGRLGCQLAGDGDWGIYNSAYVTSNDGYTLHAAGPGEFEQTAARYATYFNPDGTGVQAASVKAPAGLPVWLVAQNYPHNVNKDGIRMPDCELEHCAVLPVGVFPTPLYEAVVCIGLFFLMWGLRRRVRWPLHMFALFLIFNGVERFLVETIRVNSRYDLGFIQPTQAEIISTVMVLGGLAILLFYRDRAGLPQKREATI